MEVLKERAADAQYFSSFFYIHLPFKVKASFEEYSQTELGTLTHEYVHFLQNLTTPWGLYESGREFERIASLFADLAKDDYPLIYVPYDESFINHNENALKILAIGRGSDITSNNRSVYDLAFHDNTSFTLENQDVNVGTRTVQRLILEFLTKEGNRVQIHFGAWMIKESMAALIQERVDPSSAGRHCDVPYNVVRRWAKDSFPNIWEDTEKLVVICYCSLMSLSPAIVFQEMATYANSNPYLSAISLLNEFIETKRITTCNGRLYVPFFYQDLSQRFIETIEKLMINENADYIKEIVENTQIAEGTIPLLALLQPDLNASELKKIMDSCGTPTIFGTEDTMMRLERNGTPLSEVPQLLGLETIYKFLKSKDKECPRKFICETSGKDLEECTHTPWMREDECPMTVMADLLKIREKGVLYL